MNKLNTLANIFNVAFVVVFTAVIVGLCLNSVAELDQNAVMQGIIETTQHVIK